MTAPKLDAVHKRLKRARSHRALWDPVLEDVHELIIPHRMQRAKGSQRPTHTFMQRAFDATAPKAAWRFAGRLQSALAPPGQQFFQIVAGPAVEAQFGKKKAAQLNVELEGLSHQVMAALADGGFDMAFHEMCFDLLIGTGALLIDDTGPGVVRIASVPIGEISLEPGPYGEIWGRFWEREFQASDLEHLWPDGRFSDELRQQMRAEQDKLVPICQAFTWAPEDQQWHLTVMPSRRASKGEEVEPIARSTYSSCPLITPRWTVVAGEPWGVGPVLLALPQVKTLNKVRELALKAAGLSLLGVWMRREDLSFNPDTAAFEPGAMWTVGQTGDALMGPTLRRLDIPANFDVASFVIEEERAQVAQLLFDDGLPAQSGAVRSPTEIVERLQAAAQDYGGVIGRLQLELIRPVVQRVIDVLAEKRIVAGRLTLDQLRFGLRVVSPIAAGIAADKAKSLVDYQQLIAGLYGPQMIPVAVRVEQAIPELAKYMGIAESLVRGAEESEQILAAIMDMVASKIAAEQAASMPKGQAAPPPASPHEQRMALQ